MSEDPAPPARRAKLELLVRRDDEQGFEVREVGSALGFVQSRPQRVPADSFELAEVASRVGGAPSFILKNTRTERFLLLSEQERFLWERMDGHTSLQEIATAYVLRYGEFDFEIIPQLIRKLQQAQLLTLTPTSRLRKALARHRRRSVVAALETTLRGLERLTVSSLEVHAMFRRLYRYGGFLLFSPVVVAACLVLALAGIVSSARVWADADTVLAPLAAYPVLSIVSIKLLVFCTIAAHQVVHGLALVHYGRRVREFGFTFMHGFIPTFYIDVTDIFMASRRARVVTAVSGAGVHLILGAIWFIVAGRSPHGFLQAFAAASAVVQWQAFAVALYPFCFIEMDGYHVLVDWLGVPTLKHDAVSYVKALMRRTVRFGGSREEKLWLGYTALSVASVAAFVALNVYLIVQAF
jgi:putative peptide zinc metalloprotease protein